MNEKDPDVIKLDPEDSPLYQMMREQAQKRGPSEQINPTVSWAEDKLIPYRWYHLRWDWLRLWASLYWEDKQPASGILCPLLGRHWYKDWRGHYEIMEQWSKEYFYRWAICHHCGQRTAVAVSTGEIK